MGQDARSTVDGKTKVYHLVGQGAQVKCTLQLCCAAFERELRWIPWAQKIDLKVDKGKERLNPSRAKTEGEKERKNSSLCGLLVLSIVYDADRCTEQEVQQKMMSGHLPYVQNKLGDSNSTPSTATEQR